MILVRWFLSLMYRLVSTFFHLLYDLRIISAYHPQVRTIVVGNLTWGGTGKTPIVSELVEHFLAQGQRVSVVARSYKGKIQSPEKIDITKRSPSEWGDEAFLLAQKYPKISVIVGRKKVESVKWAEKNTPCDIIIVDDGLQHRRLKGDFYITLIDVSQPKSAYRWAPAGTMRESWRGIKRSDAIIITKSNWARFETEKLVRRKTYANKVYLSLHECDGLYDFAGVKAVIAPEQNIVVVAGLADPVSFRKTVTDEMKHKISKEFFFPDHYNYTKEAVQKLEKYAEENNALLFTTSKDAIKIKPMASSKCWREVRLKVRIEQKEGLYAQIDEVWR